MDIKTFSAVGAPLPPLQDVAKPGPRSTDEAAPVLEPVNSAVATPPNQAPPPPAKVQQAIKDANKTIQTLAQSLQFSVDEDSGDMVIKVMDKETKEVIRQIPSKEMLEIAKRLDEFRGLLIRNKA